MGQGEGKADSEMGAADEAVHREERHSERRQDACIPRMRRCMSECKCECMCKCVNIRATGGEREKGEGEGEVNQRPAPKFWG